MDSLTKIRTLSASLVMAFAVFAINLDALWAQMIPTVGYGTQTDSDYSAQENIDPSTTACGCQDYSAATTMPVPSGLFFRWDMMFFSINDPAIRQVGDPNADSVHSSNGISNAFSNGLDTSFISSDLQTGHRLEFGNINHATQEGWMGSILLLNRKDTASAPGGMLLSDPNGNLLGFRDANGDTYDDDLDGDRIYGRSGEDLGTPVPNNPGTFILPFDGVPDQPTPQDNGDLITWVPSFSELRVRSKTNINGVDLMRVSSMGQHGFSWMWGVRYIDLKSRFNVLGLGGPFDNTRIDGEVENFVFGPQIGLRYAKTQGLVRGSAQIRFMPGANILDARQSGTVAGNTDAIAAYDDSQPGGRNVNRPINLSPSSFTNSVEDENFSSVVEWRINWGISPLPSMWTGIGYTGMYLGEFTRCAGNFTYELPNFGFSELEKESLFIHALTWRLEFYR